MDAGENGFGAGDSEIDPAVLRELPKGFQVISTEKHGTSHWGQTGRINVILSDGTLQCFFIKVFLKELGRSVTRGEYQSMKAIYDVVPDFVPNPIAFGSYDRAPETHFFLCEFRELTDRGIPGSMPDPLDFAALLSALHEKSISPTGKFGFHVTTYAGNLPQFVGWEDSWETFFAKSMRQALDLEIAMKGPSEELAELSCVLFERVMPRLLRPLESNGRVIKPSLVHGDLWYGNSGVETDSNRPLVFDACGFFAHHECESRRRTTT
ncbi:Fructosamine/Ketosamine-3-kinase [Penicillium malachiteum]|uniref:Fructosamine/Ketosamine-3-kinase n=1 Tax=Penicillium malachiteum TaxID=1324776 RepID=UPI002546EA47|nr:Fructosamine/Ketosamine-3-kinase [Penicillium malachiteum]KAJ5736390.1 Fructosamine/Ketosamine-3-kinase [Penicillium malachiteum]